jgi:hypothetical protein
MSKLIPALVTFMGLSTLVPALAGQNTTLILVGQFKTSKECTTAVKKFLGDVQGYPIYDSLTDYCYAAVEDNYG